MFLLCIYLCQILQLSSNYFCVCVCVCVTCQEILFHFTFDYFLHINLSAAEEPHSSLASTFWIVISDSGVLAVLAKDSKYLAFPNHVWITSSLVALH